MAISSAFIAYPSSPESIGQSIATAVRSLERTSDIEFTPWEASDVAGKFISESVLEQIDRADSLVADITQLNFNVVFEIGYAIGRRKPIYLLRNSTIEGDNSLIREVGIFDTLGYKPYTSYDTLASHLGDLGSSSRVLLRSPEPNRFSPIYVVLPSPRGDNEIHMVSRIKKARMKFRSFDPEEHGRMSARDAIDNVAESLGVATILLSKERVSAQVHNYRAAFVGGLALGMEIPLLLLQEGEEPVPLDYRDLVQFFRTTQSIDTHATAFVGDVAARLQSEAPVIVNEPKTFLERLNLGASSAENEYGELGNYFLETDEFRRVHSGEVRVVTGRKGAGKTALFFQVRDRLRGHRGKVVLDLKPEGFQLLKFKERVLDYLEEGTKEHTITAFWEYLLLLEACHKILTQDDLLHMRRSELFEPYRKLARIYENGENLFEADFAERMLNLTQRISDEFEKHQNCGGIESSLTTGEITDLIYKHDISEMRKAVADYLSYKDGFWILFDNLDKGWPAHGITPEDVLTLRCLIEALDKIERTLIRDDIEAHGIVFIRNDVYELLVASTPDRGKVTQVRVDWTDPNLLRELLRRRIVHTGVEGEPLFEDLWRQICHSHLDGEESSQYLIDRCLMRPRGLIDLVNYCRAHAVNLGHGMITPDDVEHGEVNFSNDLLNNIDFEIQDIFPEARDILYEFLECSVRLKGGEILAILREVVDHEETERLFQLLLWYGIFGVVINDSRTDYIYDTNYDLKRLLKLADHRGGTDAEFHLNPAFWSALEARS